MLACIPTNGDAGFEDTVCEHFGSAPYFTLYDTRTDEVKVIKNRHAQHSHGNCRPMNQLSRYGIDCILCSGIGRHATDELNREGISIYSAEADRVADIVELIKSGGLKEAEFHGPCRGGGRGAGANHRGQGQCRHGQGGNRRGSSSLK